MMNDSYFKRYISNIPSSTSHNTRIPLSLSGTHTYRCYIKPQQKGKMIWRFWYSNNVDSTFADGSFSRANLMGTQWEIKSASVAAGNSEKCLHDIKAVTFNNCLWKTVAAGEQFWSDEVELCVNENEYIVFTWCIEIPDGEKIIPATPDSIVPCYIAKGNLTFQTGIDGYESVGECVMPDLFGAVRNVKKRIVFIGDSITQGCGTENDKYEQWAAQICKGLGDCYGVWNIGLGYARGEDAASNGVWLSKAALYADEVNICFGVNDIYSGSRSAEEIIAFLNAIVTALKEDNNNIKIYLFTIPTFSMIENAEKVWRTVNNYILLTPPKDVYRVFDIAKILSQPSPNDNIAKYEPHPNGIGCKAVAEYYLSEYFK